jgi:hypothetical protein
VFDWLSSVTGKLAMKYLLSCPACNSRLPVETGQAGQTIRCGCGSSVEVPSVRGLRALEQVADERPAAATWTKRKGLMFLGAAMSASALVGAAAVFALRPSVNDDEGFKINVNEEAIHGEVAALAPVESIERFQMADAALPTTFSEQKKDEVPLHLQPSLGLLIDFEGQGSVILARKEAADVMKQVAQRNEQRHIRENNRKGMNDWLVFIGIVFVVGVLTAGSALAVGEPKSRGRKPAQSSVARTRVE